MIIKAVSLFLIFMLVLGMFGKLRAPKLLQRKQRRLNATSCPECGAKIPGGSRCPCSNDGAA